MALWAGVMRLAQRHTPFRFSSGSPASAMHFRTITGEEEGFFAWLAANYLSGVDLTRIGLGDPLPETVGALDVGGGAGQRAGGRHVIHTCFQPSFLAASYDVASSICQALRPTTSLTHFSNPHLLSPVAIYDMASNMWLALVGGGSAQIVALPTSVYWSDQPVHSLAALRDRIFVKSFLGYGASHMAGRCTWRSRGGPGSPRLVSVIEADA